jgi:hypothetical protein
MNGGYGPGPAYGPPGSTPPYGPPGSNPVYSAPNSALPYGTPGHTGSPSYPGSDTANSTGATTSYAAGLEVKPNRHKVLGWICLCSAVAASIVLGIATYLSLSTINFVSPDPFALAAGSMVLAGVAGVAAFVTVVLSAVAAIWGRPKLIPVIALFVSLALPALTLTLGVIFGVQALEETVTNNAGSVIDVIGRIVGSAKNKLLGGSG